jgi:hypothetical protein
MATSCVVKSSRENENGQRVKNSLDVIVNVNMCVTHKTFGTVLTPPAKKPAKLTCYFVLLKDKIEKCEKAVTCISAFSFRSFKVFVPNLVVGCEDRIQSPALNMHARNTNGICHTYSALFYSR